MLLPSPDRSFEKKAIASSVDIQSYDHMLEHTLRQEQQELQWQRLIELDSTIQEIARSGPVQGALTHLAGV